jgi:hypothetical protein
MSSVQPIILGSGSGRAAAGEPQERVHPALGVLGKMLLDGVGNGLELIGDAPSCRRIFMLSGGASRIG